MILNDATIIELARRGMITPWTPESEKRVQPVRDDGSVSLSWGAEGASYTARLADGLGQPGRPYPMYPNEFLVVTTIETFHLPPDVMAQIFIKSSLAAKGIFLSAAAGDPGFHGVYRIAIANLGDRPVVLYPGEGIVSMVFHRLEATAQTPYNGNYQGKVTMADLMSNDAIERGR